MNRTALLIGLAAFVAALLFPPYEAYHLRDVAADVFSGRVEQMREPPEPSVTFAPVFTGPSGPWTPVRRADGLWGAILAGVAALTLGTAYALRPAATPRPEPEPRGPAS